MIKPESTRNLRSKILGSSDSLFRRKALELDIGGEKVKVYVRSPTFKQGLALNQSGSNDDNFKGMLKILIQNVFDPDTHALVFEEADISAMLEMPAGNSIVEDMMKAFTDLTTEGREAAKN